MKRLLTEGVGMSAPHTTDKPRVTYEPISQSLPCRCVIVPLLIEDARPSPLPGGSA